MHTSNLEPIFYQKRKKNKGFSLRLGTQKKGAYFCDYYLFHFSLERKTRLSEGMKKTSRKRETGRERGDMVKAHVTLTEKGLMNN